MQIDEITVTPIALADAPLLNAGGLHAPYCVRTIVELKTKCGICGVSEVPSTHKINVALVGLRQMILGKDPLNWNGLYRDLSTAIIRPISDKRGNKPWDQRMFMHVISAIEVACLDIAGKAFNVSIATLLGGVCRRSVPYSAYLFYKYEGAGGELGFNVDGDSNGWESARQKQAIEPGEVVEQAKAMVSEFGFNSIKLKAGVFEPNHDLEVIIRLHEEFGPEVPLRLDPNGTWNVKTSIEYGKLLENYLEYLEDPTGGQDEMAKVKQALNLPLATNMCTTSLDELRGSLETNSEDIILTDHHYWGGMRACIFLAQHCKVFSKGISMHSNSHSGVSLAAMTQLGAAIPNLSHSLDTHYPWQIDDIIKGGKIPIKNGSVELPEGHGLGVEIDPESLKKANDAYNRLGLDKRDDELEMKKRNPNWEFDSVKW